MFIRCMRSHKLQAINDLIFVWFGGLVVVSLAAIFQSSPGYMDAEYYYAGGTLLWRGKGFWEPYVWNYLTDPKSLPIPSHTYWMPLASLLTYVGMVLGGREQFESARILFILFGSVVSPLTYWLGQRISGQRFVALFAALMAWLPMFYLAYLPTTDTFAIYMLLGTLWLVLAGQPTDLGVGRTFLAGIICGLMHLARADGLFWMLLFLLILIIDHFSKRQTVDARLALGKIAVFLFGYGLIMGGWYGRNWMEYHSFFPPGNQRTLFLRHYNDLYRYPVSDLDLNYLIQGGIMPLVYDRLYASFQNLMSMIAVQMEILLLPLVLLGFWEKRRKRVVKAGSMAWLVMFALMSFIFPYAGWRGGYFHVAAAFQPLIWVLASEGFGVFIQLGVRVRGWNAQQASRVFSLFLLGFLMLLTVYLYHTRVIGKEIVQSVWEESQQRQAGICVSLKQILGGGKLDNGAIMINNPVGFYLRCEMPAVSVPVGGEKSIHLVAQRFGVKFLVIESDHPPDLSRYFFSPATTDMLVLIDNQPDWKIYRIHENP